MLPRPPGFFDYLLKWYCIHSDFEDIQGDLYEIFEERYETSSASRARFLFAIDVLRLFVPFTKNRQRSTWLSESYHFNLRTQVTSSLRCLRKHPFVSVTKIVGMAMAICVYLFVSDYAHFHYTFDQFHEKGDRLYRIVTTVTSEDLDEVTAWSHSYFKEIYEDFPEIEEVVRVLRSEEIQHIQVENLNFEENHLYYVDPEFGQFFNYKWVKGAPETALTNPENVVVTRTTAHKYFGTTEDILGKVIRIDGKPYVVTGMVEDPPSNSDLQFDLLLKYTHEFEEDWCFVYTLLTPGHDIRDLEARLATSLIDYNEQYVDQGVSFSYELENIASIHFSTPKLYDTAKGNLRQVRLFELLVWVMLLIAFVNYLNLYTTQILQRIGDISIHFVVGASRKQLFVQFLIDNAIYLGLAFLLGASFTFLLVDVVSIQTGFGFFDASISYWTIVQMTFVFLVLVLFMAVYALVLAIRKASLKMAETKAVKATFRKAMIGLQFGLSFSMIVATVIITRQTSLLRNGDLGFSSDKVVSLQLPNYVRRTRIAALKKELTNESYLQQVSFVEPNSKPGTDAYVEEYYVQAFDQVKLFECIRVDDAFLDLLEIKLLAGEFFDHTKKSHRPDRVFVVNESFVEHLGWSAEEAIGKKLKYYGRTGKIIGVIKNFYFNSPHELIQPMVVNYGHVGGIALLKLKDEANFPSGIDRLESVWKSHFSDLPFNFSLLQTSYHRQFNVEESMMRVFGVIAGLTLLLALVGMYAILLMINKFREKELGIRKVNGASLQDLFSLFSKEFIILLVGALLIVTPLNWYGLNEWLSDYPLRISLHLGYFLLAAIGIIMVAVLVIYLQAIKSNRINTVDILKYE